MQTLPRHVNPFAMMLDPQAVIAGSNMAYRQANAATRRTIIEYLKEQ